MNVINIEHNIKKLPTQAQTIVRNHSSPIINSLSKPSSLNYYPYLTLSNLASETRRFLEQNPNLILTRADKGNITVALDRDVYIYKMNAMLGDTETYPMIKRDPTRKITTSLRELLTRWKTREYISPATYRMLYCSDGVLPRAYGLPKVHKENCPLRIIVSSIDSSLHKLATFLHKHMYKFFPRAEFYTKQF